jgi:hypothetical protein
MLRLCAAAAVASVCALAACGSPTPVPSAPSPSRPAGATAGGRATAGTRATASPAARPRPAPPWVTMTRARMGDGAVVTLATFSGPVTYVLHDGSEDPGLAAGRVRAGPAVRGAERGRLLAVFNGGFKLSAGAGGYEQEGHLAAALRRGLASLVIDRSGRARIGIWGHGVPAPGEAVYSVRQNLPPLVLDGQPAASAADWSRWGATLGGGKDVARSALGQDAAGHLVYAASMSASPADLAAVMAYEGVRIAMELDINPEWVQLDVAGRPGGPLRAAIRGQSRPANQFLLGWARDFIAVLAPAGAGG